LELFSNNITPQILIYKNENYELRSFLKTILKSEKFISKAWLMIYDINRPEDQKIAIYEKSENDIAFKINNLQSSPSVFKKSISNNDDRIAFIYNSNNQSELQSYYISLSVNFLLNNISGRIGFDINLNQFSLFGKSIFDNSLCESYLFFDDNLVKLSSNNKFYDLLLNKLLDNNTLPSENFFLVNDNKKNWVTLIDLKTFTDLNTVKLVNLYYDINSPGYFNKKLSRYILFSAISFLFILSIIYFIYNSVQIKIKKAEKVIDLMAEGKILDDINLFINKNDEFSGINVSITKINDNLSKRALFIEALEKGIYNFNFEPAGENDRIGNALLNLRNSIELSKHEELKRKEIDEQLNWITGGAAKFAEIIRENSDNLQELAYAIISELVNYIGAVQGGLFIINEDENNEKYIELLAGYAYNRIRMLEKRIPFGVGLVGRCILERETIYMTKVPENYLSITSGLGDENPRTLLIVPLIFHEEVYGVVELDSFNDIENYKIQLTEQISESIASAVSMVKINVRTAELLRESKIKSEQAASQEEEIRQNIEEMQAITDELNLKLHHSEQVISGIKEISYYAEFDIQGRIIDISDEYLKILGKQKEDVIGKIQGSFSVEARNIESFNTFWESLKKGNTMEYQQIINVEGNLKNINAKYYPVKNSEGKVLKVISVANVK
jgi:PAS domain-containing protein